ncbi:anti-sigma factor [Frankia sp. BMG5.23]|uniref:anti-sigma factor family protein n=1 Tax=Frankia sp. BMG5.23 TaxID=683305 RepID=UPI0005B86A56|nr:zf-HC2 domain-containing protein [Frankia sp. BMG5.23]
MTEHLGDRISPLIDHQLDHDARDRALAHLARCGECQREVAALRMVKARLVALDGPDLPGGLAVRLLSLGGLTALPAPPPGSSPRSPRSPRSQRSPQSQRSQFRPAPDRRGPTRLDPVRLPGAFTVTVPALLPRSVELRQPPFDPRPGAGTRPASPRPAARPAPAATGGAARGPGQAGRPAPGPARQHLRRPASPAPRRRLPAPHRRPTPRTSMRRTLLGSAALMLLAVAGAAIADGQESTQTPGPVAVPTVSSVVAPGVANGVPSRLTPMFAPVRVSLRR